MARATYIMILAVVSTVFLTATLQSVNSSPINWDKVDLTEEQEGTVKKVDDLLNEFLNELKEMLKDKQKTNHHGNRRVGIDKVKPVPSKVGVDSDQWKDSTYPVGQDSTYSVEEDSTYPADETEAPEDEMEIITAGKEEALDGETESNENGVSNEIIFPQYKK